MNVKAVLLMCLILSPFAALAQGFAGLGTTAEGFAIPKQGQALQFPDDHGAHPDYRIEWWYVTANLTGADGRDYGVQWTLFRSALRPEDSTGWTSPQVWMGHAALTTPDSHHYAERLGRGGIGQAGVTATPFAAWIDDWQMVGPDLDQVSLTAKGADFAYDLALTATGPLVRHGDAGYSVKAATGQASYYYSQPGYSLSGWVEGPMGRVKVTGSAWLDREWSSQPLAVDQTGWDWFSLSFDDGARLMAFRVRDAGEGYTSGTWITADGTPEPFGDGALRLAPLRETEVAGRQVPIEWQLDFDAQDVSVTVEAIYDGAWMGTRFPYWEGPVRVRGSHGGRGYLEMTGYGP